MTDARPQTRPDPRAVSPPPDRESEKRVIEALIFVSDEPITVEQIGQVLTSRSADELRALVDELDREMEAAERGLRIEAVAGGYRFSTRPELAPWIRTHFRNRNRARLSPASIETLAVVAYKQPITGPEIQEIRGVDPQGAVKTLLEKRLIRIAGKKKVVGRPFLYTTTRQFLMHFGLATIDDLPPIEDFEKLAEGIEAGRESLASKALDRRTGDTGHGPSMEDFEMSMGDRAEGEGASEVVLSGLAAYTRGQALVTPAGPGHGDDDERQSLPENEGEGSAEE